MVIDKYHKIKYIDNSGCIYTVVKDFYITGMTGAWVPVANGAVTYAAGDMISTTLIDTQNGVLQFDSGTLNWKVRCMVEFRGTNGEYHTWEFALFTSTGILVGSTVSRNTRPDWVENTIVTFGDIPFSLAGETVQLKVRKIGGTDDESVQIQHVILEAFGQ